MLINMLKPKLPKCIICKSEYYVANSFQKKTILTCNNPECKLEFIRNHQDKARKVHSIMVKKELNQMKEKVGNKKPDKSVLQDIVNHIARLISKGENCISCGNNPKAKFGGHRFNTHDNANIRYNLHNIHIQDFSCNDSKSGNGDGYDKGLLENYGERYFEYVKYDLKRIYSYVGLSNFNLKEKIKVARSIQRRLIKEDQIYSRADQIRLRDDINDEIGIYLSRFDKIC